MRGTNFCACSASCKMWTVFTYTIHAQHTRNEFYHTLSIRETNFIACWAFAEPISSHAEHARKCLKVEYLGRIEYDFQKSRVKGPWDHMVSVSAKKVYKKISCLCTFNTFTITYKVTVYTLQTEWADALALFHLYQYTLWVKRWTTSLARLSLVPTNSGNCAWISASFQVRAIAQEMGGGSPWGRKDQSKIAEVGTGGFFVWRGEI